MKATAMMPIPPFDNDPMVVISSDWLSAHITDPNLCILDASWHMPNSNRSGQDDYNAKRIPSAQFFDIDAASDKNSSLPHTLPAPAEFEAVANKMGITPHTQVIIYDTHGLFSAARVWWMFKVMGHDNIAILDGGLPAWIASGHDVETGPVCLKKSPQGPSFTASLKSSLLAGETDVLNAIQDPNTHIIDVRPESRFLAQVPEPREGMRAGHMPGAYNIPFPSLLTANGQLKSADALNKLFADKKIPLKQRLITTCGSGVTAAILSLALTRIGHTNHGLYDGSWSEWGARHDLPITDLSNEETPNV